MSEHKDRERADRMNGTAPQQPEPFSFHDPATGKRRSVREMTDEELARHVAAAMGEIGQLQHAMFQAIETVTTLKIFVGVMRYEVERRRNSLVIASALPQH